MTAYYQCPRVIVHFDCTIICTFILSRLIQELQINRGLFIIFRSAEPWFLFTRQVCCSPGLLLEKSRYSWFSPLSLKKCRLNLSFKQQWVVGKQRKCSLAFHEALFPVCVGLCMQVGGRRNRLSYRITYGNAGIGQVLKINVAIPSIKVDNGNLNAFSTSH